MSERDLKIFELYGKLAELLGDKEAIADLKKLYERHPEMFKNMQEVSSVIAEVVKEPEIIVDATHSNKDTGIYKAARRLGDKKMGDVGIRNDDGTNVIFHANKQDKRQFDRLLRKAEKNQLLVEASSANAAPTRSDHYASKSNNLPKCNKAPSITDKSIVSQTINKYQIVNKRENESVILKRLDDGDIEFVDKKGTTRKLTQDAQNLWKQTFELDSIEQIYIPKQSKEVLESLGYKELKLTKGSLLKLVEKDRVQYIPQIKETLENADFILRDIDNMVIFAKQIKDKEYFTSINLETQDY
ncbi:hypothetical protein CCZ01_09690, partial [Helicobacter monodelphidis]|uniref:hypothetical protein n=1 Tax=Helicobacter sp. 15-1451 TaxID=2004995 RepID=UPI000DCED7D3